MTKERAAGAAACVQRRSPGVRTSRNFALDAVSGNVVGALLFVVLLPLVIAGYAMWARLTSLHDAYPPQPVSAAAFGAIVRLTLWGMATGL